MAVALYLFKSAKLGFRNWQILDLTDFTSMNADPLVMRYFPSTLSAKKKSSKHGKADCEIQRKRLLLFCS